VDTLRNVRNDENLNAASISNDLRNPKRACVMADKCMWSFFDVRKKCCHRKSRMADKKTDDIGYTK